MRDSSVPNLQAALTNTVVSLKGQAGQLCGYTLSNPSAAWAYVQVFDAATPGAVTLGTTTPKQSYGIPAGATITRLLDRLNFNLGIQIAATTTATGSTAPATALTTNFEIR